MDAANVFLDMAHREEDREWRKEDRAWRTEDRMWRKRDVAWREEDRAWRRNDRRYRILDDARRKTDEWAEMINDIANVSALLAGFATAALVEAPLDTIFNCYYDAYASDACSDPDDYEAVVWWAFGFAVSTSIVAALMLANVLATVTTSTILLQNYNKHPWRKHEALWQILDDRWYWIVARFYVGMFFSMVSLASLTIIKFSPHAVSCWSAFGCVALIGLWALNDAVGLCSCCAMLGCCRCMPRCCGCCQVPARFLLKSRIQRTFRRDPLKSYHHGDDAVFRFEEPEGADMAELDEYREELPGVIEHDVGRRSLTAAAATAPGAAASAAGGGADDRGLRGAAKLAGR